MPISKRSHPRWTALLMAPVLAMTLATGSALAAGPDIDSLITANPEEGFALAVKLSQKAVATTQTDAEVRKQLRPAYAHNPDSLIAVSQVVATHFQTIAAANNYWRDAAQ